MRNRKVKVKELVNEIIRSLYRKDGKVSLRKIKKYGFQNEGINWGDLTCLEVEYKKGKFYITIEEAFSDCYEFRDYIADELKKEGIDAEVFTEW